jgi:hypothetical protein
MGQSGSVQTEASDPENVNYPLYQQCSDACSREYEKCSQKK